MSELPPERMQALAYLQQKLNIGLQKAREKEEMVFVQCDGLSNMQKYRSCIRTTALVALRSSAQSPPPTAVPAVSTRSLPYCKQCKSNSNVTFKFDQRRSGDEGMTAVYTCEKCNIFWT